MKLSEVSLAYARKHVDRVFAGRKGHGGMKVQRRKFTRSELLEHISLAFELGQQLANGMGKVR